MQACPPSARALTLLGAGNPTSRLPSHFWTVDFRHLFPQQQSLASRSPCCMSQGIRQDLEWFFSSKSLDNFCSRSSLLRCLPSEVIAPLMQSITTLRWCQMRFTNATQGNRWRNNESDKENAVFLNEISLKSQANAWPLVSKYQRNRNLYKQPDFLPDNFWLLLEV